MGEEAWRSKEDAGQGDHSPTSMTSEQPGNPITVEEIRRVLVRERPELVDEWDEEGTTAAHLARVAANAQWNWDHNVVASSTSRRTLPPPHLLRAYSIEQAIWMATLDDLYNENTFERHPDAEPLLETQLRSGWFSI